MVYNALGAVMPDKVACKYSFYGQQKKEALKDLTLCSCIFIAVKGKFPTTGTDDEIKKSIKMRLDMTTTRVKCAETAGQIRSKSFMPVLPELDEEGQESDKE
ncbi:uncharacterized protein LOC116417010 [Nasonia vitripennis]|uniref:Uncharacterized protein n=1 Tax=Nasonia vitripennis TaxID=7425 RepID=A0A7M7QBF2_NASVI|nr:uncharacterized protein LOC116417010 [Nasonia vitripennis]